MCVCVCVHIYIYIYIYTWCNCYTTDMAERAKILNVAACISQSANPTRKGMNPTTSLFSFWQGFWYTLLFYLGMATRLDKNKL